MGVPSSMEYLLGPLKNPKVISQDSRKAFEQVLTSAAEGYLHADVERWRGFFPSKLKTVPKVKASTLNLNDVKGGEGLNIFFRANVVASSGFMKEFHFNSEIWSEQKLQLVNEMRAVFVRKDLSQDDKAVFGKLQMMRAHAALDEAHRQDETEERVVYARIEPNKATTPGGKATVGAPGLLQHITWHSMMEALDMQKGYHQVGLSRVASAMCSHASERQ